MVIAVDKVVLVRNEPVGTQHFRMLLFRPQNHRYIFAG